MRSLFDVNVNWYALFGFAILLLLFAPGTSLLCLFALMVSFYQFLLVFYSMGYVIPVRYLAGSLMCLQMLVGPSFAYMGLDDVQYFKYKMQVPQLDYFSYAIPAVCAFIIGLNFNSNLRGEFVSQESIKKYVAQNPSMMYIFIGVGFVASVINSTLSTSLDLVFYLLGSFKFIGAFLLIIGARGLKPLPLFVVFSSIILSSLGSAMFHDLFTWMIFILAVFAMKYKPPVPVKAAFGISFIILVVVVQQLKGVYREATQFQGKEGNLDVFGEVYQQQESSGGFFDKTSLSKSNVRINQGFIVTYVMKNVPENVDYARGSELYIILEAAFLPRFLAPDKLKAGDNSLVTKYSGIQLKNDTSMSLSSLADGYINFGTLGGIVFMFCLGGLFNFVLIKFDGIGKKYPVAILFTPLVFYFPMRPDTALQTGLGHLVKACFLLYMILLFYKHHFRLIRLKQKVKLEG